MTSSDRTNTPVHAPTPPTATVANVTFAFATADEIARGFLGRIRFALHLGEDEFHTDVATLHLRFDGEFVISWARRPKQHGERARRYLSPSGRTLARIEDRIWAALFPEMDRIVARARAAGLFVARHDADAGAAVEGAP